MITPDPGRTYSWVLRRAPVGAAGGSLAGVGSGGCGLFNTGDTPIDITKIEVESSYLWSSPVNQPYMPLRVERVTSWTGGVNGHDAERLDTNDAQLPNGLLTGVRWIISPTNIGSGGRFRSFSGNSITPLPGASQIHGSMRGLHRARFHTVRGSTLQGWVLHEDEALGIYGSSALVDLIPVPYSVNALVKDGSGTHKVSALIVVDPSAFGQAHPIAALINPSGSGVDIEVVDIWIEEAATGPSASIKAALMSLALAVDWKRDDFEDGLALDVTNTIVPHDPAAPTPPVLAMRGPFAPLWWGERLGATRTSFGNTGSTGPASLKNLLANPFMLDATSLVLFPRQDAATAVMRGKRSQDCRPLRLQPNVGLVLKAGSDAQTAQTYSDMLPNVTIEFTVTKPRKYHAIQPAIDGVPL